LWGPTTWRGGPDPGPHDDGMSGAECLTSRRFLLGAEKIGDGQHGIEDFDDIVDY
jgi:hypothetical protein